LGVIQTEGGAVKSLLLIASMLLWTGTAYAERGEWQLQLAPALTFSEANNSTYRGFGGSFITSYGLLDWLSVDGDIQCSYLSNATDKISSGLVTFNATRCSLVPALAAHFGVENIFTVGAGAGYRFEIQSSRELGSDSGVFLKAANNSVQSALVATAFAGFERRFFGRYSAGLRCRVASPLIGSKLSNIDIAAGLTLGLYFYP
jgi:hypothetical protein